MMDYKKYLEKLFEEKLSHERKIDELSAQREELKEELEKTKNDFKELKNQGKNQAAIATEHKQIDYSKLSSSELRKKGRQGKI